MTEGATVVRVGRWFGAILGWGFLAIWAAGVVYLLVRWVGENVSVREAVIALGLLGGLIVLSVVGSRYGSDYRAPFDDSDGGV